MLLLAAFLLFFAPFCTSQGEADGTAPRNVSVTASSSSAVSEDRNPSAQVVGNFTNYSSTLHPSLPPTSSNHTDVEPDNGSTLQSDVTPRLNNTDYQITVSANSSAGQGTPSAPIKVHTPQNVPTVPLDVSATALSTSSVRVQWKPPAQVVGNITYYNVTLRPLPPTTPNHTIVVIVNGSTLQTVFLKLLDNTDYLVTVSATSSVGQGTPSAAIKVHTPQKVPTVPLDVSATALSSSAVRVQWKPPAQVEGELTNYNVTLSPRLPPSPNHIVVIVTVSVTDKRSTLQIDVLPLLDDTGYAVTVSAISSAGQGTPSEAIVVHTLKKDIPHSCNTHWPAILILVAAVILLTLIIISSIIKKKNTTHSEENVLLLDDYRRKHV